MFRLFIQDERRVTNPRTSPHLAITTTIDTKYDCGGHVNAHIHALMPGVGHQLSPGPAQASSSSRMYVLLTWSSAV